MFSSFLLISISMFLIWASCIPILGLQNSPSIIYFLCGSLTLTSLSFLFLNKLLNYKLTSSSFLPTSSVKYSKSISLPSSSVGYFVVLIGTCLSFANFILLKDYSYVELHSLGFSSQSKLFNSFSLLYGLFTNMYCARIVSRTGQLSITIIITILIIPFSLLVLGFRMPFFSSIVTLIFLYLCLHRHTYTSILKAFFRGLSFLFTKRYNLFRYSYKNMSYFLFILSSILLISLSFNSLSTRRSITNHFDSILGEFNISSYLYNPHASIDGKRYTFPDYCPTSYSLINSPLNVFMTIYGLKPSNSLPSNCLFTVNVQNDIFTAPQDGEGRGTTIIFEFINQYLIFAPVVFSIVNVLVIISMLKINSEYWLLFYLYTAPQLVLSFRSSIDIGNFTFALTLLFVLNYLSYFLPRRI